MKEVKEKALWVRQWYELTLKLSNNQSWGCDILISSMCQSENLSFVIAFCSKSSNQSLVMLDLDQPF